MEKTLDRLKILKERFSNYFPKTHLWEMRSEMHKKISDFPANNNRNSFQS
jgi:hypothetical protein